MAAEAGVADRLKEPWRTRLREAAVPAFAGGVVMASSLINFLNHNQYPLLRPEIGLLAAALLAIVLLMGLLYAAGGRIVRMVLQVLLVYVALDLNFDGLLVPIATIGIVVVLQRQLMPFVAVGASVVLLTVLAGIAIAERGSDETSRPNAAERRSDLPVLVHLILDEHIGIEGLLADMPVPEAAAMGQTLKHFYLDRGFRLFGGAYSEHIRTVNAIPQVLNFGKEQPWNPSNRNRSTLSSNAYFDRLGAAGYRIRVMQTDYMDYCENEFVVRCETRRAAELTAVASAPLSSAEKADIVAGEFAKLSGAFLAPAKAYHSAVYPSQVLAIPPLGPLAALDRLVERLRVARPGSAYFVHELLPHTPYALGKDCRLHERSAWRDQSNGPRRERMAAYLDQVACLKTKLAAIIEAAGPNAVIVVQGDHGSRITNVAPGVETSGAFDDSDLIAGHSTLFAIRAPDITSGYERRALPIAEILRRFAMSDFRSADVSIPPDFVPSVVLEDSRWKPAKRHPLPETWPAPEH